jgi:hypothetical protein
LNPCTSIFKNDNQELEYEEETLAEDDYGWSEENLQIQTKYFYQERTIDTHKQKQAWLIYLQAKGYSDEILNWISNSNNKYNVLNDDNTRGAKLATNAISHEYKILLRQFNNWIISILNEEKKVENSELGREEIFLVWEQCSLSKSELLKNFRFTPWLRRGKINGHIQAWHDNCDSTPDGLKLKKEVYLSFVDYVTFDYLNETSDWSYISETWNIEGYQSEMEQYINQLTSEGVNWIFSPSAQVKTTGRISRWLLSNVFSIIGVL